MSKIRRFSEKNPGCGFSGKAVGEGDLFAEDAGGIGVAAAFEVVVELEVVVACGGGELEAAAEDGGEWEAATDAGGLDLEAAGDG